MGNDGRSACASGGLRRRGNTSHGEGGSSSAASNNSSNEASESSGTGGAPPIDITPSTGGPGDSRTCGASVGGCLPFELGRANVALYFLVDVSASMNCPCALLSGPNAFAFFSTECGPARL